MKETRFKDMQLTLSAIKHEINYIKKDTNDDLFNYITDLLQEKLVSNPPIRAYFTRKIFEYISGISWNCSIKKIAFLMELVITVMYLENQILDRKDGVNNKEKINQNLISSHLMKNIIYHYTLENFDIKTRRILFRYIIDMFYYFA